MSRHLLDQPTKILWHWLPMGPYHFARMSAVAQQPNVKLTVVETARTDDHGWRRAETESANPFSLLTLSEEPLVRDTYRRTRESYFEVLQQVGPDVIVESGYAEPHSRLALFRYVSMNPKVRVLVWSESTVLDRRRFWPVEKYKGLLLSHFDGALVAGTPHVRYMRALGMSEEKISIIGGTVDNEFFSRKADELRAVTSAEGRPISSPYFLYVGRLIPVKNLAFLLRAFHLYRVMSPALAHDLVIVGDGPDAAELRAKVKELRIDGVHFAGNKQLEDLPSYYAFASAFVLPSLSEPWGLVINEAMASGLPVLASTACGAAEDLVKHGETGFVFDPHRVEELALQFAKIAAEPERAAQMGESGRSLALNVSLPNYAARVVSHIARLLQSSTSQRRAPAGGMLGLSRMEAFIR